MLDDAEVWVVEEGGDVLVGEGLLGVVEEAGGVGVGGVGDGVGGEEGVGGVVGAEGLESFVVDDEVFVCGGEVVFFGEYVVVVDGVESCGDGVCGGWGEDGFGDGGVGEDVGAVPGGDEGVGHGGVGVVMGGVVYGCFCFGGF